MKIFNLNEQMKIESLKDIVPLNDLERLILLRNRLGLKQYEFAKEIGISNSYYIRVENGKVPFTRTVRIKVDTYIKKLAAEERI